MPSVVIIHAAEDALPARALAEKIRLTQLDVQHELSGEALHEAIRRAAVTVALWSPRAVAQPPLIEEADFARGVSTLIHCTMQNAAPPSEFADDGAVNLTGWRGESDFAPWRQLADLIAEAAGVAPLPAPAPRPGSAFFQPGGGAPARRAPRPRAAAPQPEPTPAPETGYEAPEPRAETLRPLEPEAPESRGGGMMIAIIGAVAVVLAGGGYLIWNQMQGSQAASAWENVSRDDPEALRAFITGHPGEFRDEAQTALRALEQRSYDAAREADSIEALEAFLAEFPDSEHSLAARGRIAELRSLPAGPEPLEPAAPGEAPDLEPQPDPDLLPLGTTPEASGGGPTTLTPPPAEEPTLPAPGQPEPGAPSN